MNFSVPLPDTGVDEESAKFALVRSDAAVAVDVIELRVYVAVEVAPEFETLTALVSELNAPKALFVAVGSRPLKLVARPLEGVFGLGSRVVGLGSEWTLFW